MNNEKLCCKSACEDQINMAARELSAFIRSVTELFGPEQASLSTEDWLVQSEQVNGPHKATKKDWRAVTVAASAGLANRLTGARDRRTPASPTDPTGSPILSSNCFASALLV